MRIWAKTGLLGIAFEQKNVIKNGVGVAALLYDTEKDVNFRHWAKFFLSAAAYLDASMACSGRPENSAPIGGSNSSGPLPSASPRIIENALQCSPGKCGPKKWPNVECVLASLLMMAGW